MMLVCGEAVGDVLWSEMIPVKPVIATSFDANVLVIVMVSGADDHLRLVSGYDADQQKS